MKKFLPSFFILISLSVFSQTQTDKLVQNAANYIKSGKYSEALTALQDADQNDYRVSYMQIVSLYSITQMLQNSVNTQASQYVSKYAKKNTSYTNTVSQLLEKLNGSYSSNQEYDIALPEPESTVKFPPVRFGAGVADFERISPKTKKLYTTPNYSLIRNPKEISEFLQLYQSANGENFFKGVINFCHFYEISSENKDGTGTRKMLDLRNGQLHDVPSKMYRCATTSEQEFSNNSNIYILKKCDDGNFETHTYSWDESTKNFSLIKKTSD